jgi:hypothetical protein
MYKQMIKKYNLSVYSIAVVSVTKLSASYI